MPTLADKHDKLRIEIRVTKEDKDFFEYAAELLGYNLSEFIRRTLRKEANTVVEEQKQILASQRDKDIFFSALMGQEEKPNQALISALRYHSELTKD